MRILDLVLVILAGTALSSALAVVWKIRNLKAALIDEHREKVDEVIAAVGEICSLNEAKHRAPQIIEIMKRYEVIGLVVPMKSGDRVNFHLQTLGLRIEGK